MATFSVNTKADKDSPSVQTKLSVDWTGVSEEILKEIALSAIVIKWQGQVRKQGIPAQAEIRAIDYRPGVRLTAAPTIDQLVSKLTAEEKQKLLEKLMAE